MSSSEKKRSRSVSRLHRISAYLPNIFVETDSKSTQEKLPPLPQNANLAIRQPSTPEPSADTLPVPAIPPMPTSAPPAPPPQPTSNKLQKEQSPPHNTWPLNGSPSPDASEPPTNPLPQRRGRHGSTSNVHSLAPPSPFSAAGGNGNRAVSSPITSRPTSYTSDGENSVKASKRRSFFPSKTRSRHSSPNPGADGRSSAWLVAGDQKIDYNISLVTNGDKVKAPVMDFQKISWLMEYYRYQNYGRNIATHLFTFSRNHSVMDHPSRFPPWSYRHLQPFANW